MTVLVAVGVMNVGHGGAGSVIFVEKLSRYGKLFGQTVGVATGGDLSPGDLVSVAASWPARLRHADDVRQAGLLFQDVQQLPAGLLTAPAGLLTEPAMLVTLGMPLTLVAAALTDGHASLQQQPGETGVEFPWRLASPMVAVQISPGRGAVTALYAAGVNDVHVLYAPRWDRRRLTNPLGPHGAVRTRHRQTPPGAMRCAKAAASRWQPTSPDSTSWSTACSRTPPPR